MFSSTRLVFLESKLQKIISCHLQDVLLQIGQVVSKLKPILFLQEPEIAQVTDLCLIVYFVMLCVFHHVCL